MSNDPLLIRRASGEEAASHARSLPPHARADAIIYEARRSDGSLAAYGAVGFWPKRPFASEAHLWVQVARESRRQGLGSRLLEALLDETGRDADCLILAARPLETQSEEAGFLERRGFRVRSRQHLWEASVEALIGMYQGAYTRQLTKGKVPAGARVAALSEITAKETYRVVSDNMGFSPEATLERMQGGPSGYSQTLSRVLLLNEKPEGAILAGSCGTFAYIHAHALSPIVRGTGTGMMLKMTFLSDIRQKGFAWLRFDVDPQLHLDTEKLARRTQACLIKTTTVYQWVSPSPSL